MINRIGFEWASHLYGDGDDTRDDLSPARGLLLGSALGLVFWVPIVAYFFG